jgi:hypothetical protein
VVQCGCVQLYSGVQWSHMSLQVPAKVNLLVDAGTKCLGQGCWYFVVRMLHRRKGRGMSDRGWRIGGRNPKPRMEWNVAEKDVVCSIASVSRLVCPELVVPSLHCLFVIKVRGLGHPYRGG